MSQSLKFEEEQNLPKYFNDIKIFFACLAPKKSKCIFFFLVLNVKKKKLVTKKSLLLKIKLEDQHRDASESRANFGIYVGNQKHPKLSTRTYGFTHVF